MRRKLIAVCVLSLGLPATAAQAAAGTPLTPAVAVNDSAGDLPDFVSLARNAAGESLVGWEGAVTLNDAVSRVAVCKARKLGTDGGPIGSETIVGGADYSGGEKCGPVAIDAAGGGAMVYSLQTQVDLFKFHTDLKVQRLSADGSLDSEPIDVASNLRIAGPGTIAMNGQGAFAVAWIEYATALPKPVPIPPNNRALAVYSIKLRIFNSDGTPKTGTRTVMRSGLTDSVGWAYGFKALGLAMADDGRLELAWMNPVNGRSLPVYAQRLSAEGLPLAPPLLVDHGAGEGDRLVLSGTADGSFAVGWQVLNQDYSVAGFARLYPADQGPSNSTLLAPTAPALSLAADGRLAAAWLPVKYPTPDPITAQLFDTGLNPIGDPFVINIETQDSDQIAQAPLLSWVSGHSLCAVWMQGTQIWWRLFSDQ